MRGIMSGFSLSRRRNRREGGGGNSNNNSSATGGEGGPALGTAPTPDDGALSRLPVYVLLEVTSNLR